MTEPLNTEQQCIEYAWQTDKHVVTFCHFENVLPDAPVVLDVFLDELSALMDRYNVSGIRGAGPLGPGVLLRLANGCMVMHSVTFEANKVYLAR